jgi:hypothetical protein
MVSKQELEGLARKAVAALVGVFLVMALMSALLIAGLVLLLWAATAGLTPVVGQAGALAISGGACFLLLGLFFWRLLSTRAVPDESGAKGVTMRERLESSIRENPLEGALGAFTLGVFGQADPRFRTMVLRSGMAFMRQAQAEEHGDVEEEPAANDEAGEGEPLGGKP